MAKLLTSYSVLPFQNPRSGCKHKAWGGAKRNPRLTKDKSAERAKRAIAPGLPITNEKMLPPTSRALPLVLRESWGSASLHPRLYAVAALRGLYANQNGVYYFLPYNTDLERLLRTGVPFTDIKNTVQSLAGKTLFFIDTCHSGNVLGGRRGLADDLNGVINELASAESGAVVFAASTGNRYSLEDAKWNNGAVTKALVEGFMGRADYGGNGRITINMLDLYISERVKELTGGKQTPTTAKPNTVPDFPIAVKR